MRRKDKPCRDNPQLVNCGHDCAVCGWNPEVRDERVRRIRNGGMEQDERGRRRLKL